MNSENNKSGSMKFIPAICTSCGGELMLPSTQENAICNYCGSRFIVDSSPTSPKKEIDNLLKLAIAAEESNNTQEAYEYYTKVLEYEPDNYYAWYGKSISAGWLSKVSKPRIVEMIRGVTRAIELTPVEFKEELIINAEFDIFSVTLAFHKLSKEYMKEYIELDNTWVNYVSNCLDVFAGLDAVIISNPQNEEVIDLNINLSKELIEGEKYYYRVPVMGGSIMESSVTRVSEDTKSYLWKKFNENVNRMVQIRPSYKPPIIKMKKNDCFIATATLGQRNHPYIVTLRRFRDETLINSLVGRKLVEIYYLYSPTIAKVISQHNFLRKLSLYLIIRPFTFIARYTMKRSIQNK